MSVKGSFLTNKTPDTGEGPPLAAPLPPALPFVVGVAAVAAVAAVVAESRIDDLAIM